MEMKPFSMSWSCGRGRRKVKVKFNIDSVCVHCAQKVNKHLSKLCKAYVVDECTFYVVRDCNRCYLCMKT